MPVLSIRWPNVYEFACHSAACRPPTSGGTGGSTAGNAFQQRAARAARVVVDATDSPHYKRREAAPGKNVVDEWVTVQPERYALALVRNNDATGRRILDKGLAVADGQAIGVRANLNVKKTTGITVQTMHAGTDAQLARGTGMFAGEAIGYGAAVTLRNVNFSVNQAARHKIATGQSNKFPMASVDGRFQANPGSNRFDGVELRFNPMRSHLFTDPDGRAVKSAAEATVVGSQVFVRGKITYFAPDKLPAPLGGVPSEAHA